MNGKKENRQSAQDVHEQLLKAITEKPAPEPEDKNIRAIEAELAQAKVDPGAPDDDAERLLQAMTDVVERIFDLADLRLLEAGKQIEETCSTGRSKIDDLRSVLKARRDNTRLQFVDFVAASKHTASAASSLSNAVGSAIQKIIEGANKQGIALFNMTAPEGAAEPAKSAKQEILGQ